MSARVLIAGILLVALAFSGHAQAAPEAGESHFFTSDLPEPDAAKVIFSESSDSSQPPEISLGKKDARALAALIRAQSWDISERPCENSQYTIHFYVGKKLLASESLCFHCRCLKPLASDVHTVTDKEAFDVNTPKAQALLDFLEHLFPQKS